MHSPHLHKLALPAQPSAADYRCARAGHRLTHRGPAAVCGCLIAACLSVVLGGCSPVRQSVPGPASWPQVPPLGAPATPPTNTRPLSSTTRPLGTNNPTTNAKSPTALAYEAHREELVVRGQGPNRSLQPAPPSLPYNPGPQTGTQPSSPFLGTQPARPAYETIPQGSPEPAFGQPAQPAQPGWGTQPAFGGQPGVGGQPGLGGQPPLLGDGPIPADDGQIFEQPGKYVPLDAYLQETQTGRFMFGVGVNSDAGVVGSIIVDEQNFDWRRVPYSFDEIRNGTAFRGAGQRFRIEAAPGTQVQRYMFNFSEPYLFDTPVSLGLSGFYYNRQFRDWTEGRLGGRVSWGYQISPDLAGSIALRAEQVNISNPRIPTPPPLAEVLGDTALYSVRGQLAHDTRDNTFMATEGHYIELAFEQGFGDFTFPRATVDMRKYFLLHERPDGSGRHVLSVSGRVGVSGNDTPIYERFFAGGFSTLRGFQFRGASPVEQNVIVGGDFQALGSVEYLYPITADDMLKGVAFVDFGTVEQTANIDGNNFRCAPGVGLRVTIPAMGPAPIALDFAFPVAKADTDLTQVFSFFVGFGR